MQMTMAKCNLHALATVLLLLILTICDSSAQYGSGTLMDSSGSPIMEPFASNTPSLTPPSSPPTTPSSPTHLPSPQPTPPSSPPTSSSSSPPTPSSSPPPTPFSSPPTPSSSPPTSSSSTSLSPTPSSSSPPVTTQSTDTESQQLTVIALSTAVAVGGIIILVLLTLLLLIGCIYVHKLKGRKMRPDRDLSPSEDNLLEIPMEDLSTNSHSHSKTSHKELFAHIPDLKSIPLESFPAHVQCLHGNNEARAAEEYESIKYLDPPVSKIHGSKPCNEAKNRYINILPNDETRVVLSTVSKVSGSDYINGNFIDGYNREDEYIATQGPLSHTVEDFWRMVWEQNIHIIIMVTNTEEGGVAKCHEYWPDHGSSQFDNIIVTAQGENNFPEFAIRQFSLTNTLKIKKTSQVSVIREVVQYHFTAWPDFGVPQDPSSMLKFVRRIRSEVKQEHGPILIHCSAGVGRTGTFVAVDVMLQKMEKGEPLDVMEFVCRMRAQRNNSVQTCAQYLFVHDTLLKAMVCGDTEVGVADLKEHIAALSQPLEEGREGSQLDWEFQKVMAVQRSEVECTVALREGNADKNRSPKDLPLDDNRVVMEWVEGEDYINASLVNGYSRMKEFVATQHPLPGTRGDFWRMVLETDTSTIITIGPLPKEEDAYWPQDGLEEYGVVSVELLTTRELDKGITVREMQVEWAEVEASVLIYQYHLWAWPEDEAPPTPGGMLSLVQESRSHWRETGFGMIVVHSTPSLSSEASGVYCALAILRKQAEVEGSVDVVTVVSGLREQRPGLITSKEFYRFIYSALADGQCQ